MIIKLCHSSAKSCRKQKQSSHMQQGPFSEIWPKRLRFSFKSSFFLKETNLFTNYVIPVQNLVGNKNNPLICSRGHSLKYDQNDSGFLLNQASFLKKLSDELNLPFQCKILSETKTILSYAAGTILWNMTKTTPVFF